MAIERSKTIAEQVNTILRDRIRDKTYPPGVRLPSESELAKEFSVSRATIRTVLAQLSVEGLILRKQGDGTYVNERLPEVNTHLGGLWEFSRLIESSGYTPTIRALKTEIRLATIQEAHIFNLESDAEILCLDRVFFANDRPVILAQNVLPTTMLKHEDYHNTEMPIREFIKTCCQREIAYAISDIRAALSTNEIADILEREVNSPLLKIKMTFYDRDNQPLLFGTSYFDDLVLNLRLVQAWG